MAAYYNENDPYTAQWLRNLMAENHICPGFVDERSIADVQPGDLTFFTQHHFFAGIGVWSYALRRAGWPDDRPVWTGSCPCQPFSGAGKRGGTSDDRHLWPVWFDLIRECRPGVILGEQVASPDGLGWWDAVQDDLEGAAYASAALDLCVPGVGGPHIRQRLYWMAHASSEFRQSGLCNSKPSMQRRGQSANCSAIGRLADANGGNASAERKQRSGEQRQQPQDGCLSGRLDHTAGTRCNGTVEEPESQARDETRLRVSGAGCGQDRSGPASPLNGFWRDADWLFCRDGKWRPVEPGTQPLAHGAANRVGRLRAYGNAIVAPQATEFIETVMECLP